MSDLNHPVWSLAAGKGHLLLTPCPGTQDVSLQASLAQLKAAGATTLITLMTVEELSKLGVTDIAAQAEQAGLRWLQLPIADEAVPDAAFERDWQHCNASLNTSLEAGEGIAIHCKGGAGRTGLIAARLLLDQGQELAEIIPAIQALRPRAFHFQAQRDYIHTIAHKNQGISNEEQAADEH